VSAEKPAWSATVAQIEAMLFDAFPRAWAEPWDRPGLLVGDPRAAVTRVALALDPTPQAVRAAAREGCQVLVTHHPCHLDPPPAVLPPDAAPTTASGSVWEAVRAGVALVGMHTNLDRAPQAAARLPRLLGLEPDRVGVEQGRRPGTGALGSTAPLPPGTTVDGLALLCREAFGRVAQVYGDGRAALGRAAFFTGSLGTGGADALAAGADAVVCGECGYHRALDLVGRGCAVIILGHDASENPLVPLLGSALGERGVPGSCLSTVTVADAWHSLG
jgi:putative NIF3 family GTP cyclohydrolase 1 type 2